MMITTRVAFVTRLMLLVAFATTLNFLLARALARRREIAIRVALGLSKRNLVRMLGADIAILAVGASVVALLSAWGGGAFRAISFPT